jgi:RHS repeat-associated protein
MTVSTSSAHRKGREGDNMKKLNRVLPFLLASLLLTACKIDLTVVGNGTVKTESGTFNCTTGASGDCVQSYVNSVADCPNYVEPLSGAPIIPANCTVLVSAVTNCTTAFANGITWQNCVPDDNGMGEIFHPLAAESNHFTEWTGDGVGCAGQTGACAHWIDPDSAGTDTAIGITANFAPDVDPQNATYTHNYLGQRVSKTAGGLTTYFIYSDLHGQLMGEYKANGDPLREYIYAEAEPVAMLSWDYSTTPVTKNTVFLGNNHLGQPVLAWDNSGNPVYERVQTPFGETMGEYATDGLEIPLGTQGVYRDKETGFADNWNRTIDPAMGRFLQSDPIGLEGGINTYAYTENNPVMLVDPLGLEADPADSAFYHPNSNNARYHDCKRVCTKKTQTYQVCRVIGAGVKKEYGWFPGTIAYNVCNVVVTSEVCAESCEDDERKHCESENWTRPL